MLRVSRLEALSAFKARSQNGLAISIVTTFSGPSRCSVSIIEQAPRRPFSSALPNTQHPEPQLIFPPRKFNSFPKAQLPQEVDVQIQQDYDSIEATCQKIIKRAEDAIEAFYVGFRMNRDEPYVHLKKRRDLSSIAQELRQFVTEKPSGTKLQNDVPPQIVQIALDREVYLFRLTNPDRPPPPSLIDLLSHPKIIKVSSNPDKYYGWITKFWKKSDPQSAVEEAGQEKDERRTWKKEKTLYRTRGYVNIRYMTLKYLIRPSLRATHKPTTETEAESSPTTTDPPSTTSPSSSSSTPIYTSPTAPTTPTTLTAPTAMSVLSSPSYSPSFDSILKVIYGLAAPSVRFNVHTSWSASSVGLPDRQVEFAALEPWLYLRIFRRLGLLRLVEHPRSEIREEEEGGEGAKTSDVPQNEQSANAESEERPNGRQATVEGPENPVIQFTGPPWTIKGRQANVGDIFWLAHFLPSMGTRVVALVQIAPQPGPQFQATASPEKEEDPKLKFKLRIPAFSPTRPLPMPQEPTHLLVQILRVHVPDGDVRLLSGRWGTLRGAIGSSRSLLHPDSDNGDTSNGKDGKRESKWGKNVGKSDRMRKQGELGLNDNDGHPRTFQTFPELQAYHARYASGKFNPKVEELPRFVWADEAELFVYNPQGSYDI